MKKIILMLIILVTLIINVNAQRGSIYIEKRWGHKVVAFEKGTKKTTIGNDANFIFLLEEDLMNLTTYKKWEVQYGRLSVKMNGIHYGVVNPKKVYDISEVWKRDAEIAEYDAKKKIVLEKISQLLSEAKDYDFLFESEKDSTNRTLIGIRNKIADLQFTNSLD